MSIVLFSFQILREAVKIEIGGWGVKVIFKTFYFMLRMA